MATNGRAYLLDVTRLVWRQWVGRLPTGIDRVCLAYLDHYRRDAQAVVQWPGFRRILSETTSDRLFDILIDPRHTLRRDLAWLLSRERLRVGTHPSGNGRLYFNVGHTALEKEGYLRWTREVDVRPVYMIHDLIPISHPEYCRAGEAERHVGRVRNMLASAVGIIGNSRATLESLEAFAADQAIAVPATVAIALGTDLHSFGRGSISAPERPTFVMLGTIEARKNHLLLLEIWARLVRARGPEAPHLLIIGQRGWECEHVFDLLDRNEVLRGAIREIGVCSDEELGHHLRGARALLFPTLAEGFGLPLIEALTSGTPVIASDLKVFREIGQEVPEFIDPLDAVAWQLAIEDYTKLDSARRAAQVNRLAGFSPPRWSDHFASVGPWSKAL